MTSHSAEAVAREMADEVASSAVYHLNQMYPRWRKDEVKTMPISLRGHLSNAITSALTTFAAQQVQATWDSAAVGMYEICNAQVGRLRKEGLLNEAETIDAVAGLLDMEFNRRAQEGSG